MAVGFFNRLTLSKPTWPWKFQVSRRSGAMELVMFTQLLLLDVGPTNIYPKTTQPCSYRHCRSVTSIGGLVLFDRPFQEDFSSLRQSLGARFGGPNVAKSGWDGARPSWIQHHCSGNWPGRQVCLCCWEAQGNEDGSGRDEFVGATLHSSAISPIFGVQRPPGRVFGMW